jgi:outer membrane protein assembly factor BamA
LSLLQIRLSLLNLAITLLITLFCVNSFSLECSLNKISINDLKKTNQDIIYKTLRIKLKDNLNENDLNAAIVRLKNLQIFSKVESKLDYQQCILELNLVEKWTTIPILKFGSGGGTKYYILGLYDVNVLGNYQEVGGQYENFQNNNSFVIWYRNPQLINDRLKLGFDVWDIMREKLVYTHEGQRIGGYTLSRRKLNLFTEYKILDNLTIGAAVEKNDDLVEQKTLSDEVLNENLVNSININQANTNYVITSLYAKLGTLNYDNELVDGYLLSHTYQLINNQSAVSLYQRNLSDFQFFKTLFDDDTFASRFTYVNQNTSDVSQAIDVGGLSEVRGYFDGQFRTNELRFLNLEYRKKVFELGTKLKIQAVLFYDRAQVGKYLINLESSGLGVRFISPDIYRLNLRFDYVFNTQSEKSQVLSFGLQQFF